MDVLVTLTNDIGKILPATSKVALAPSLDFLRSMKKAMVRASVNWIAQGFMIQIVLKHRANRASRQRIIVIIGSPIGMHILAPWGVGREVSSPLYHHV